MAPLAGGFAAGMQHAIKHGYDWVWLFNDDAFPYGDALATCLTEVERLVDTLPVGIVCPSAMSPEGVPGDGMAIRWRGQPVPVIHNGGSMPMEVDGVTFNGALVSGNAIRSAGLPRRDYFMMFEEWEFCLRVRRANFGIFLLEALLLTHLAAGSHSRSSPPWRGYYQTRNHLALALERRSGRELLWWGVRQAKFAAGIILYMDSKRERLRLRFLGAWDGLRGRMGRTIDPADYSRKRV